jgi:hypothetical protein
MTGIAAPLSFVVEGFLGVLSAVVAMQLLNGGINLRYLLHGRSPAGGRYFSPERVQLLTVTIWVAFNYLLSVMANPTVLPDVPPQTLALLGGSHVLYLGGKTYARLAAAQTRTERART